MTSTQTIRELAEVMRDMGLSRLDINENGSRITLERTAVGTACAQNNNTAVTADTSAEMPPQVLTSSKDDVKAPLVGTVYLAPKPGEAPFVSEGKAVKAGDVLCTVEAMKMFNEIKAPHDGVVTAVYVKNGQGVGYGERLFTVSKEA